MPLDNPPSSLDRVAKIGGLECNEDAQKALAAVEAAAAEVREIATKLEAAEANLSHAEAEYREALAHPRHFQIKAIYNGIEHLVATDATEMMKALLDAAIKSFGQLPNPHTLALFTTDDRELPDNISVKDAGIKPCEKLLLRPSTVKGGAV